MATLETSRLRLRPLDERDADFIVSLENDEELWAYGDSRAPYPESVVREYVLTYDPDPLRAGQLRLVIEDKETQVLVGTLDLTDVDPRALTCTVGIAIAAPWRRKGFAAEALRAVDNYCRTWLGITNLRADVAADNEAALALFRWAGYAETGILRRWRRIGNRIVDVVIFQRLY